MQVAEFWLFLRVVFSTDTNGKAFRVLGEFLLHIESNGSGSSRDRRTRTQDDRNSIRVKKKLTKLSTTPCFLLGVFLEAFF